MSTGSEGDGDSGPKTDVERFSEANREFQQQLERIPDDDPSSPVAKMEAAVGFLESIAELDAGPMIEEQAVSIVAEKTERTKKATERELAKLKKQREREDRDRPEITQLITEDVDRVEALASSETDGDVRFRFVFRQGGSVVVDHDTLWSSTGVRRAFASEYGRVPVFDSPHFESWEDVVDQIFEDRLEWKADAVGPRQVVIDKVTELVEKHAAHTEIERAYSSTGVFIPDEDSDVVYVESSRIEERAEEKDETLEAIRWEFDDRGLRAGSSERKRVQGKAKNWWPLKREHFEPKRIESPDLDPDADDADDGGDQ